MNCKEGKKNSTSWSRPVARCSELSRKLCFFCNRETRFVEEQKEGECAYSALLQLSVLYPGSEVLWCEIRWNFHGLLSMNEASYFPHPWIYYSNNTFYNELSLAAASLLLFLFRSRSIETRPHRHLEGRLSNRLRSYVKPLFTASLRFS